MWYNNKGFNKNKIQWKENKKMGLKMGTVKLEEYNPKWKDMFDEEKTNLKEIFGDLAINIEHIGSTSIEGLSSKPIIDISVTLKSLNDFEKVKEYFEKEPYSVKEDSVIDEQLVRKGPKDNITHLIHIMEESSARYKNTILFRDYIRNHIEILREYEQLKKDLAEKYADNRPMYTASKNDFIQKILKLAYDESIN